MSHSGSAVLPLHGGKAPRWLFSRMVQLAECIVDIVIDEYGHGGLLERLSDPWFFQSLSCVLGYDWHSSGTTTVTCGALKMALDRENMGVTVCGGKGRTSLKTPQEIREMGQIFGLSGYKIDGLVYASRMSAKVDNSLVQDSYKLYHHCLIFDEQGDWIVIQQGINEERGNARRYHWGLDHRGFIEEPQDAIICETRLKEALNMTSKLSKENRDMCLDLVRDNPMKLKRTLAKPVPVNQSRLDGWTGAETLVMPRSVNWDAVREAYQFQPRSYEEMVSKRGIGPGTIRGLALVAELIYGERASWSDPVRFNFAFGGKDGVPFPVDRKAMDEAVDVLRNGIKASGLGSNEELRAIQRLKKCVPDRDMTLRTVL
ncbi:MAG: DUF763 domain-containing protein [Candidatus Bathyarchaeota archaeon]|nr:DUF763 domain-containing protein [Candidatus Bathyarchaeota archaeon]